jgi:hypothetical protein
MEAVVRPRRLIRCRQRTRRSRRLISRIRFPVPSGELSSTKITSQLTPIEYRIQQLDKRRDIVFLVEGWNYHSQFRARGPGVVAHSWAWPTVANFIPSSQNGLHRTAFRVDR